MIDNIIQGVAADMVDHVSLARDLENSEFDMQFLAHRIKTAIELACVEHASNEVQRYQDHLTAKSEATDTPAWFFAIDINKRFVWDHGEDIEASGTSRNSLMEYIGFNA